MFWNFLNIDKNIANDVFIQLGIMFIAHVIDD